MNTCLCVCVYCTRARPILLRLLFHLFQLKNELISPSVNTDAAVAAAVFSREPVMQENALIRQVSPQK